MQVLTRDGWSTQAGLALPQHRRRHRFTDRPGRGQPARHRFLRLGALPEDSRPVHRGARIPATAALRRADRPGAGVRGPLRRAAQRGCPGTAVLFAHLALAFRLEAEDRDERVLRFFEGAEEAQDTPHAAATRWPAGPPRWALQRVVRGLPAARRSGAGAARRLPCRRASDRAVPAHGDRGVRSLPRLEPRQIPGDGGRGRVRARGGRGHRHDGSAGRQCRTEGVRLRARRHRPAGDRARRHGDPGGIRLPGGTGRRPLQLGRTRLGGRFSSA